MGFEKHNSWNCNSKVIVYASLEDQRLSGCQLNGIFLENPLTHSSGRPLPFLPWSCQLHPCPRSEIALQRSLNRLDCRCTSLSKSGTTLQAKHRQPVTGLAGFQTSSLLARYFLVIAVKLNLNSALLGRIDALLRAKA